MVLKDLIIEFKTIKNKNFMTLKTTIATGLVSLLFLGGLLTHSAKAEDFPDVENFIGVTGAGGMAGEEFSVDEAGEFTGDDGMGAGFTLHAKRLWGIGFDNQLRLGAGLRFGSFFGDDLYYETAPARLAREGDEYIDWIAVEDPQMNALNITLNIEYQFNPTWKAGFNIDLAGVSFGDDAEGVYVRNRADEDITKKSNEIIPNNPEVVVSPTSPNYLIMAEWDNGTLNSEFFGAYSVTDRVDIRAGMNMLFTEYTTDEEVQQFADEDDNDRFRNEAMMGFVGVDVSF